MINIFKHNYKEFISLFILIFINFLFSYKYLLRLTKFALLFSLILSLIQIFIYLYRNKINISQKFYKLILIFLFVFIGIITIYSHFKIALSSLNVDRWSVISSFLEKSFEGKYPYFAHSHMGNPPGPMPFYFLVALPFYLIGWLSLLSCLGYCLFLINLKKYKENVFLIFYFLTSFFMLWEIMVRSNLFTFTYFVLLVIINFLYKKNNFYFTAILAGLLLSTRSIYIVVYIIVFLSSLINRMVEFKKLFRLLTIALISFLLTFVPYILFFNEEFFKMNPFIIQSSFFLPKYYTLIFILIAFVASFFVKEKNDVFFFSGVSLFIIIFIYSMYYILKYGFIQSYFDSLVDISYYIFSVPFLLYYLMNREKRIPSI